MNDPFESAGVHVGVDLGGLDVGVPQQLLNHPKIRPAGKQVGGEAMA